MTNKLRKEYVKAANRNKIMVSPVGLAFHEVNKNYPSINLYTKDLRFGFGCSCFIWFHL